MLRLASIAMNGRRVLTVETDYDAAVLMARDIMVSGGILAGAVPGLQAAVALLDNGLEVDSIMLDAGHAQSTEDLARLRDRGVDFIFVAGFDDWFEDEELDEEAVALRA